MAQSATPSCRMLARKQEPGFCAPPDCSLLRVQVPWHGGGPAGNAFPPEAVEAVLLWADPWLSARVFGAGLYALICLRQVALGAIPGLLQV